MTLLPSLLKQTSLSIPTSIFLSIPPVLLSPPQASRNNSKQVNFLVYEGAVSLLLSRSTAKILAIFYSRFKVEITEGIPIFILWVSRWNDALGAAAHILLSYCQAFNALILFFKAKCSENCLRSVGLLLDLPRCQLCADTPSSNIYVHHVSSG